MLLPFMGCLGLMSGVGTVPHLNQVDWVETVGDRPGEEVLLRYNG